MNRLTNKISLAFFLVTLFSWQVTAYGQTKVLPTAASDAAELRKALEAQLSELGFESSDQFSEKNLVVLSACATWDNIGELRRGLETDQTIAFTRARSILALLSDRQDRMVIHLATHGILEEGSNRELVTSFVERSANSAQTVGDAQFQNAWFDLFWKHIWLERDHVIKKISEDEYKNRKEQLRQEETQLFKKYPLTPEQMQTYYARVSDLPGCFLYFEKTVLDEKVKKDERPLDVKIASIVGLFLALIAAGTGFFFSWSKYRVESHDRRLKELQVEELQRKLNEQLAPNSLAAA